ncbi:uncharacterized protein LOC103708374 [Phoenix dactylifera]|uniref:Uncharacterized protein LOC103708374 n=1 Tax=Phoenix dactylifera TaxID=42345 RepID=A0A8B7C4C7_PHODC|nr:uncharacterized protein LOC103708374 [Phoenix dactylifera]
MLDSSPTFSNKKNKRKKLQQLLFCFFARIFGHSFSPSSYKTKAKANPELKDSIEPPIALSFVKSEMKGGGIRTKVEEAKGEEVDAAGMKRSVKQLHFGGWEEKGEAALEIKRLAKVDARMRRSLAKLGVIPSLVSMLAEAQDDHCRHLAIEALIELAHGTFTNKALMVEAGLLVKLPQLTDALQFPGKQELAVLLFSISSLAKTQFPIAPCHIIAFLTEILNAKEVAEEIKITCLATLYNLSTKLDNTRAIVSSGAVPTLISLSSNRRASEGALAIMGNLILSAMGKKVIEDDSMVPKALIDTTTWFDKPRCQELAVYILMILAHGSKTQRQKMAGLGMVPLLLEVALLGSPLAQKRALKMLQWFKDEGQSKIGVHSGPQTERISLSRSLVSGRETNKCQKAVKQMVEQSLSNNMEAIMRRARVPENFSSFKSSVASSSSKSLPY